MVHGSEATERLPTPVTESEFQGASLALTQPIASVAHC